MSTSSSIITTIIIILNNAVITVTICGSAGKESTCNVGDLGSIPGLGRPPGEEKGYPLHSSGLENSMDCIVHEVAKSQIQLSDFLRRKWQPTPVFLPGASPWTEEPGGLQSMG